MLLLAAEQRSLAMCCRFLKPSAERDTHAYGMNAVGLERRGFDKERIRKIHHAYRVLLASKLNTSQAIEKLKG